MAQLSPTSSGAAASSSQGNSSAATIASDALLLSSSTPSTAVGGRAGSPSALRSAAAAAAAAAAGGGSAYRHPSPFPSRLALFDVPSFVESFPVKRKRPHAGMDDAAAPPAKEQRTPAMTAAATAAPSAASSSPSSASLFPSASSPPAAASYTLEQVKRIVLSALALQEERLREEYGKVLNDLLREQFENFERFNRDYISRQISKHELSYLS